MLKCTSRSKPVAFVNEISWLLLFLLFSSYMGLINAANQTIGHGFALYSDIQGPDREFIQYLLPLIEHNHRHKHCTVNGEVMHSLYNADSSFIDQVSDLQLLHGGLGIVSNPRKRATALLTKAALTLPQGDIVETGTFIGTSAAIILKVMQEFDSCDRKLWVFDSFEGLPPPTKEDEDQGSEGGFQIDEETFIANIKSANLYDPAKLVITKGWFKDVCKQSPVQQIAFLRLDGDLFASTWDALVALYDRVIPGGFIYVDDYGSFTGCRKAVDRFRNQLGIFEPLHFVRENEPSSRAITFEAAWWMKRVHQ